MDDENTEQQQGETLPGAGALDELEAEAVALEGLPGELSPAQTAIAERQAAVEADQVATTRAELGDALRMARMVAAPAFKWWPDFGACWSDGQIDAIADAGAQVMQRHGLTTGELLSQWGPYIALGVATVPPGLATYSAIKHRKAEMQERQQRPQVMPAEPDRSQEGQRL